MESNNVTSIRQMLEQLPTDTLREMLDKELHTEPVNGDSIRLILSILREREKPVKVEMTPNLERAWEKYQRDTDEIWKASRRSRRIRSWATRAAAAAAVLVLLLVPIIPQEAGAESFWDALVRWTTEIVEFFGPNDNEGRIQDYEFKTDNPGLQQVYDAVVALGITDPVVPMWLPEGYELVEFLVEETRSKTRILSRFDMNSQPLVFCIDIIKEEVSRKYQKDDTVAEKYEYGGVDHFFLSNNSKKSIVWEQGEIACLLTLEGQDDTLYKIVRSIYSKEDH